MFLSLLHSSLHDGPDVGDVRAVVIGHDNSGYGPSWHVDAVEVRSENLDKLYSFPCNLW